MNKKLQEIPLHLMLLPGVILTIIFSYVPIAGIVIAFQKFVPSKGIFHSKWIGLDNFRYMLEMPNFSSVVWNTVFIAVMKIIVHLIVPVIFALLLNEVISTAFKRTIQTIIYFPYFLSWVILGGILIDILSPSGGIVNQMLGLIGIKPIFFLGNENWFPFTLVASDTWKEFGYSTIVYLAALTAIDQSLYEAAVVDGANRWKQTLHVTIPGMLPIVTLMTVLSLGNVLNAGFDQVFNLYSPMVYSTGDIIDTMVYRIGLVDAQYGVATAVGLFKSVIAFILIVISNKLANRYTGYRIF
ncbi:putative multiple-sugar transport system permease YteP [Paenibacillus allorhizoplanae]|jgi:putative aldouronate transport system permease protein|uniref:Multiple-sugar transport system permease YteP n=1 Tax=Paenibacillus allorhizoplanae TaxID=2905648 RepID=A0ABM9BNX3_9BACL|nr:MULTISPECIES: ABC transporter permease subunit [Paenibacillus]KRE64858.1 protein lplB [Paenibacillus sp. Soil750]CAH1191693.1 putative multiple-sugar transport system permease YteP [Paenibacillus allorhizoplanae]